MIALMKKNKFKRNMLLERSKLVCWQNQKELSPKEKEVISNYRDLEERLDEDYNKYLNDKKEKGIREGKLLLKQFGMEEVSE